MTNNPPYIGSGFIPDQILNSGTDYTYKLQQVKDREGQSIIFQAYEDKNYKLPAFVKFNKQNLEFEFSPKKSDA